MRIRWWMMGPSLAAAAVVLAACGTNSPSDPGSSNPPAATNNANAAAATGSVVIKTMSTSHGKVLTTSAGKALYWFAKDTPMKSNCSGTCAQYWPPLMGTATAAAGTSLPHGFGTIKRANGQTQVTYDGHPLYTYTGDTAAGMITGNDLRLSGGKWWAMTATDTRIWSKSVTSSGSSGSGGSGGSSGGGW